MELVSIYGCVDVTANKFASNAFCTLDKNNNLTNHINQVLNQVKLELLPFCFDHFHPSKRNELFSRGL